MLYSYHTYFIPWHYLRKKNNEKELLEKHYSHNNFLKTKKMVSWEQLTASFPNLANFISVIPLKTKKTY